MKNKKTTWLVGIFILLAISFLLIDNNWMNGASEPVTISSKRVEQSTGKNSHRHSTYFWVDHSNRKYKVPEWLYNELHLGDSFLVKRSVIFNKVIRIQCSLDGYETTENIGVINDDWFGIGLCAIAMLLSVVEVFAPGIFKNEEQQFTAFYLSILLTAVIIAFYFIFST
ncbi:MAG: hypothetical protein IPP72_08265 [Chitinophagaceae bacterium]|nr:hypothetical protein [Chitinophagaceae bacterium]